MCVCVLYIYHVSLLKKVYTRRRKKKRNVKKYSYDYNYINDVNFPPAAEKFDDFFGLSEVYYNVMETTLNISPKTSGSMNGILEVGYQGCWEGGVCYPLIRKSLRIKEL